MSAGVRAGQAGGAARPRTPWAHRRASRTTTVPETSQRRFVRSRLALRRVPPSGLKSTEVSSASWPVSVRSSRPVAMSQSLIVLSVPPLARMRPVGSRASDTPPRCGR